MTVGATIGTNERWGLRFDVYRRRYLNRNSSEWRSRDEDAATAIEKYEELLDEQGLIDFDGMVLMGLHLVRDYEWVRKALVARFPILIVDEYQDLGYALDSIVRILSLDAGMRLVAVGDPDQSIYGFTGANPSLLKKLAESDHVETFQLKLNYRCGSKIIDASIAALAEERDYQSNRDEPGEVFFHKVPEGIEKQAQHICNTIIPTALKRSSTRTPGNIAILYKDKNDGDTIASAVEKQKWKFLRVDGNNPYQSSPVTYWLEDCAAWCAGNWKTGDTRLSELAKRWLFFHEKLYSDLERRKVEGMLVKFLYNNRLPDMPLHDWLNVFMEQGLNDLLERGLGLRDDKDRVENLIEITSPEKPLCDLTVAFFGGLGGSPEHINLTTLHSSKGLEYDVVIIFGLEDGRIPFYNDSDKGISESRRLFYVGLTRARYEVHLVYSGWYENQWGRKFEKGRSRFVDEVYKEINPQDS